MILINWDPCKRKRLFCIREEVQHMPQMEIFCSCVLNPGTLLATGLKERDLVKKETKDDLTLFWGVRHTVPALTLTNYNHQLKSRDFS